MIAEQVIYETSSPLPGLGVAILITVWRTDFAAGRMTRESHVFLPDDEVHLHEIAFEHIRTDAAASLAVCALRATHLLLARHVTGFSAHDRWLAAATCTYGTVRQEEHPFFRFRLMGRFRDALWEMQDWTISEELRGALAQVTAYRSDSQEAELLARVFLASERVAMPEVG